MYVLFRVFLSQAKTRRMCRQYCAARLGLHQNHWLLHRRHAPALRARAAVRCLIARRSPWGALKGLKYRRNWPLTQVKPAQAAHIFAYVAGPDGLDRDPQDALKELVQAALDVSQIPVRTGRGAPTVIT